MIWQLAIAAIGPRLVELRDDPRSLEEEEDDPHTLEHLFGNTNLQSTSPSPTPPPLQAFSNMKMQYTSSCPIPPPLHTCHTSRTISLHRWTLCLAKQQPAREIWPPYIGIPRARIFFDFSTDILFCPDDENYFTEFPLMNTLGEGDRERLRFLAVDFMLLLRGTDEMLHGRQPRPGVSDLWNRRMWENIFDGVKRLPGLIKLSIVHKEREGGESKSPVLCNRRRRPKRWGGFSSGFNLLKHKARADNISLPAINLVDVRRFGHRTSNEPYLG
jgi:hypothetical protein